MLGPLGWLKICKLAHAFLWEHSCKGLKLAQLLGQLGVSLTFAASGAGGTRILTNATAPDERVYPPLPSECRIPRSHRRIRTAVNGPRTRRGWRRLAERARTADAAGEDPEAEERRAGPDTHGGEREARGAACAPNESSTGLAQITRLGPEI